LVDETGSEISVSVFDDAVVRNPDLSNDSAITSVSVVTDVILLSDRFPVPED
jgi:hypothetical protein